MSLFLLIPVTVETCDEQQLVFQSENERIETVFFNLLFFDSSKKIEACNYLKKAEKIELEEEMQVENGYYIYTDGKMLQKIAIEMKWARINFDFEDYLYQIESEDMLVNANEEKLDYQNSSILILSFVLLLLLLCLLAAWLL